MKKCGENGRTALRILKHSHYREGRVHVLLSAPVVLPLDKRLDVSVMEKRKISYPYLELNTEPSVIQPVA